MRFSSEPRVLHSTGVVPLPGAMAVAVSAVRTIDRPAIDVSNMVPKRSVISYALAVSPVSVEPHASHSRHPLTRERRERMYVLRRDDMPRGVRALNRHAERCICLHERGPGA